MIPNPADAKFAKVGQVFANLRAVNAASFCKGIRGYDLDIIARKIFKHLHIGCKALDCGSGDVFALGWVDHGIPSRMRSVSCCYKLCEIEFIAEMPLGASFVNT